MMALLRWTGCWLMIFFGLFTASAVSTCTVPSQVQGQWNILDVTRTTVENTVDITATGLSSLTFWTKTLTFDCYLHQGNYYIFVSEPTDLFDQYDVHVYFCWYLQSVSSSQYRLYELTEKVLYTIEERAKAFLNTSTPIVNDVCEIPFGDTLSYKQMEVVLQP